MASAEYRRHLRSKGKTASRALTSRSVNDIDVEEQGDSYDEDGVAALSNGKRHRHNKTMAYGANGRLDDDDESDGPKSRSSRRNVSFSRDMAPS